MMKKNKIIDYDKHQLAIGRRIEMEHTTSKRVAERIAKDHLNEYPTYYVELVKMEAKLKKKHRKV